MNRDRPEDADEDKGDVEPLPRLLVLVAAVEHVAADMQV